MVKAEKYLKLQEELAAYKKALTKAAEQVRNQDISDYPIFVFHQQDVEIGVPIIHKDEVEGQWSVRISSLEEFAYKGLILENRVDDFKTVYREKDPAASFCLFVLSELGAQFIFVPKD